MAVTKVINSESKQYKPVLVDSLVLDAAPTVGSLNGVTSDGVAKAISGSGSVPTPTADDDGKVLTANDGSFGWSEPTGGDSYTAGTGITISEENAIAVTEAISSGAAAGATAVQPAALNDYALSSSLATVATTGAYSDLSGTPTIPTVDQNYNAASTNAQSGVAVAQAIAAIPSEVSTASGHFDLEGSVPVTVNYTGTPHVVSDYITLTNPTTTTVGTTSLGIVFSTQGNKSLGSDTANLVISDTIHAKFTGIYYAMNPPSPGPAITTSTGSITSGTIEAQTIVLSGSNPAESFGIGNDVIMLFSDLTDGETAETIMTKVSIQHWPASVVDGYETTIPVVDQNYHSESANAQSGVAVAQAIAAIPTWSSDYGASVDNSTHKINVTAITPADKQINVLGKTNVPNMTLNLVNPNSAPDFTTILANFVRPGEFGEDFDCVWISKKLSSSRYPNLDNGSAVTLYLNIPNDVVLTGSYSGVNLSSTGFRVYDSYNYNSINITSSVIDSSNILKIQAGRYAVTMNMSHVYDNAMLSLSINSWLESGGSPVALDASDKTLILTAMADWTFDCPMTTTHYEMDITAIPAVTSSDDSKVLTASYSGGVGSYSWETAQGGGGASYTAENPIAIESDVIKLKRNRSDFAMTLPFDTVSTSPESTYQWAVQTQINLPGSASLGSTKLCVIVGNESSNDLYINASGSTGWTVIAYKPSDATTLYTYANESYEYVKTSGSWNYIAGRNSGKPMDSQQYYTFTFPAGASVGITGNLCFAIVPKASDGLTGSSPWNTPYADAYMFTSGGYLSTESNGYIYSVPTGSGDVSSISVLGLSNTQKLPSYTSLDSGKVLQVQNNGTLAWVTLS